MEMIPEKLSENDLKDMLLFANAAASIVTTKKGAICSMPEREEVKALLEQRECSMAGSKADEII